MYARVSIAQSKPGKTDEVIRIQRESVLPAAKQQKGFKGLYLLTDRKNNKGITITLRETEADMTAGEASGFYQQQVAKFKDVLSVPPVREDYEVSIQQ
jgi:heme-degrading monooxygenase HmoA